MPAGFTEQEWSEKYQPFYFMTAPKGIVVGVYTSAREALDRARPGLRIMCGLGTQATESDRTQVWPPKESN